MNLLSDQSLQASEKVYKCDQCEYTSKKQEHLKRHKTSVHLIERNFICDTCGRRFKRKDILDQHSLTHSSSSTTFPCELCNNSYRTFGLLKEHKASHENKRNMKCTLCPKAFNTKMVLDKHTKNVHETPGYP